MAYDSVLGYQCNECGSTVIRFARHGDRGLYESDTLVCCDCLAGGNEQTFAPSEDTPEYHAPSNDAEDRYNRGQ